MNPQWQDWPQLGRKPARGPAQNGRPPPPSQTQIEAQPHEPTSLSPYQHHSIQLFDPEQASLHWRHLLPIEPEPVILQDPAILRADQVPSSNISEPGSLDGEIEQLLAKMSIETQTQNETVKKSKSSNKQRPRKSAPPHFSKDPLTRLIQENFRDHAIQDDEIKEKEAFRLRLESLCRSVIASEGVSEKYIKLLKFGSIGNGFATKGSDMDLILVSPQSNPPLQAAESPLPLLLEQALLEQGIGARLLTNTRVPIIKLCEKPTPELLQRLKDANEVKVAPKEPEKVDTRLERARNETIWNYFKRTKYRLFANQGRDYSLDQSSPLSDEEFDTLNNICVDFLNGLNDETLAGQLHTYIQSTAYWPLKEPATPSLFTLYFVVEAVRLSHAWWARIVPEAEQSKEAEGLALIKKILAVLNRPRPETLSICSNLRNPVERLLAFPSLQLHLLQQAPNEWQTTYYTKANNISMSLISAGSGNEKQLKFLTAFRYVAGLYDESIRREVIKFCDKHNVSDLQTAYSQVTGEQELRDVPSREEDQSLIELYAKAMRTYGRSSTRSDIVLLGNKVRSLKPLPKTKKTPQLEFPKTGIGIQSDITFTSHLALQNTLLLRCYAQCDPRVKPLALFVKSWAKKRNINTPYHGTLSSYGYVLMVLHYLMNIAVPPVIPNLQAMESYEMAGETDPALQEYVAEYNVKFWRDEPAIREAARLKKLTSNVQSLGELATGFFQYYAPQGRNSRFGFDWAQNVVSIRWRGGIKQKRQKGWTGLKVTVVDSGEEKREVKNRYLLAIEDPFEINHNVGRTVTQAGLTTLQAEFARAEQIISSGSVEDLMYGYEDE